MKNLVNCLQKTELWVVNRCFSRSSRQRWKLQWITTAAHPGRKYSRSIHHGLILSETLQRHLTTLSDTTETVAAHGTLLGHKAGKSRCCELAYNKWRQHSPSSVPFGLSVQIEGFGGPRHHLFASLGNCAINALWMLLTRCLIVVVSSNVTGSS